MKLNSKQLMEKWAPVLNEGGEIKDLHKKRTLAMVLENTVNAEREDAQNASLNRGHGMLNETVPANFSAGLGGTASNTSGIDAYDPIMIGLLRRSLPNLMAFDVASVQPMYGPTSLIFAMKSNYTDRSGAEALFNEADTDFTGTGTHQGSNPAEGYAGSYGFIGSQGYLVGRGVTTAVGEDFGGTTPIAQMAFTIEKSTVEAKTRMIESAYTTELQQDLRAVHNLSADEELLNILQQETLFELNREVIRTIYRVSKQGAQSTAVKGTFDLDVDSNGRWSVERFKGLHFQLEREANVIAQETRRGKGNIIMCSADVASALAMTGKLDYTPALENNLQVDDTGNTFAGILNGRFKVYVDPYSANINAASQFAVVGYKGSHPWDAGLFYCPYVPMQVMRMLTPGTYQPRLAIKTRYGLIANPYVVDGSGNPDAMQYTVGKNQYYRGLRIQNLM